MKRYDEYESLIAERLKNEDWEVSELPLIPDLNTPQTRPQVYVIFTGSTFEDVPNFGDFAQNESLLFEVYIISYTRSGEKGVFRVAEEIIQKLLKWSVPDTTEKITLQSFGYADIGQNNWRYDLRFSFPRLRIMHTEEEKDQLLIKQINQKWN
jgi:hypothetical protein